MDAERFVLGSVLQDDVLLPDTGLSLDLFSTERHRRIARRINDLLARGERVDSVTLVNELQRQGEYETDTLSYLLSLDEGLPRVPKIDSYIRILQDKASRRRIIFACQNFSSRAQLGSEDLDDITAAGQELFSGIALGTSPSMRIAELPDVRACGCTEIEYLRYPELPKGGVVGLTGDSGSGKSTFATACARDIEAPVLFLDRENPLSVFADRLDRLNFPDSPRLRVWGGWYEQEAPLPDAPAVIEWVKTCDPRPLVVVDSLAAFHGGDENAAGEMRAFMYRCRRLADMGATVVVIHHSGKGESSADYRGSSDFKASLDQGYHVSSFARDGRLDKLILRPFKSRIGSAGEITYSYDYGKFTRGESGEARETINEQLTAILRLNPGVKGKRFEELAAERTISRSQARTFLFDGMQSGFVQQSTGSRNLKTYSLNRSAGQYDL
jgi:hypothetical protein